MKGSVVGKYLIVALLSVVLLKPINTFAQQRRPILFWNLENYFDPFDDSLTRDDEFTPGGQRHWSWRRFETKRNHIAKVLIALKDEVGEFPVIAAFAEVENRFVLDQLVTATPLVKLGYKVIHRDSPDRRGIDVALIYREDFFTPLEINNIEVVLPNASPTRDILKVRGIFSGNGVEPKDTVNIFVIHFPSKWGSAQESLSRRKGAANVLVEQLESIEYQNAIVMGDFNDTPDSEIFEILGSRMDVMGGEQEELSQGSIKYKGRWELIDNFLISENFSSGWEFSLFRPSLLLEEDSQYLGHKPYRTYIGPTYNGGVSDHLPVYIVRKW